MTRDEWFAATEPDLLLDFIRGRVTERKLLLFACGCARLSDATIDWGAVPVSLAGAKAMRVVVPEFERAADADPGPDGNSPWAVVRGALALLVGDVVGATAYTLAHFAHGSERLAVQAAAFLRELEFRARAGSVPIGVADPDALRHHPGQCAVLRDVIGDPFDPPRADPRWRTGMVAGLAAGIYEQRAYDRLPILADALQEAGCDDDPMLSHCRGEGPHVRGCWVLDLILGKT